MQEDVLKLVGKINEAIRTQTEIVISDAGFIVVDYAIDRIGKLVAMRAALTKFDSDAITARAILLDKASVMVLDV